MQWLFTKSYSNQQGAVAVIVGLCLVMFIGFAALAIDVGNLMVARNELQNAADAGALAGARNLYTAYGTVNENANQIAFDAAKENNSQNAPVDVNWDGGNIGDVQRGHYSFAAGEFRASDATGEADIQGRDSEELDGDWDFINAVRVFARRDSTPILSFFAGILGFENFQASAEAVAYLGFAGSLMIDDIDLPIAICERAIVDDDGNYNCSIGRMINSGQNVQTSNTGGWTSYVQPCSPSSTGTSHMRPLMCSADDPEMPGNPEPIQFGEGVSTTGGMVDTLYEDIWDCWWANSDEGTKPWEVTLIVVECDKQNVENCSIVRGAVTVTIIWTTYKEDIDEAPVEMDDWPERDADGNVIVENPDAEGSLTFTWEEWTGESELVDSTDMGTLRWESFVDHFNLQNLSDETESGFDAATHERRSIYFLPSCEAQEPRGDSGGENFNILARIPKLVQ